MHRYKTIVEYDGTSFFGWQRQQGYETIQRHLEESVFPLTKVSTTIHGAGRTDAGVHALGQVAHFDSVNNLDCFRIQECMNAHLRHVPISVLSVEKVDMNFDARFSALERTYLYKILNRRAKAAVDLNRAWQVVQRLNEEKMHNVAQYLLGKHDFTSFRASGCQANSSIKTLNRISVKRDGDIIILEVSAPSFLYHQVRNIVGSLLLVGSGKWTEQNFIDAFQAKDRTKSGQTAPACGLYFLKVSYL